MSGYMPDSDGGLAVFVENLMNKINLLPEAYGVTADQANAYEVPAMAYINTYGNVMNPTTTGPMAVAAKNTAREAVRKATSDIVAYIKAYPGLSDAKRVELMLPIPKGHRTPIPVPADIPTVDVVSVVNNRVTLRCHATNTPGRRGKPAGSAAAALYTCRSEEQPGPGSNWKFEGNSSTADFAVEFAADVPLGTTVWFVAQWLNPRMKAGFASTPISVRLQGSIGDGMNYPRIAKAA